MKYVLIFIISLLSIECIAQEINSSSEEYVILYLNARGLNAYNNGKSDIKSKDIFVARVGDKIIVKSETLGLSHTGYLEDIGSEYLRIDGIEYSADDLNIVYVNGRGRFPGAILANVALKTISIYSALGSVSLLIFDEASGAILAGTISAGLWAISTRIGNFKSKDIEINSENQFRIRKLVPDSTSLTKD